VQAPALGDQPVSLATTVTILQTRRDAVAAELAAMPLMGPNFSLDGVSINNVEYAQALRDELLQITEVLEDLQGPCVVFTQGR
jgi:hypothetical protein